MAPTLSAPSGGGDRARLVRAIDILVAAAMALALLGSLRCTRRLMEPLLWALVLPCLACLIPSYRRHALRRLRRLYAQLEAYPAGGRTVPWRAVLLLIVLPMGVGMLAREPGLMAGDTRPVVLTAIRLLRHGDWELSEFAPVYQARRIYVLKDEFPGYLQHTRRGIHSSYPAGMVPFAMPAAAVARGLGANLADPDVHTRLEKWTASWVAALCLGLFALVALHLGGAGVVLFMTVLLGAGSVVFSTIGQGLWQQGGVIVWMLVVLLVELHYEGNPPRIGTLVQAVAGAMMLACRLSGALFIGCFGLWVLWRSPRRGLVLGLLGALAYLPWGLAYWFTYGTIFGPSMDQTNPINWQPEIGRFWAGVLFSPVHGMLIYQPWLVLVVWSFVPMPEGRPRSACPGGWSWMCAAYIVVHLLLISTWLIWWGGDCWGSRLAAEAVVVAGLLCMRPAVILWASVPGRAALVALALFSCLFHVPAVYDDAIFKWQSIHRGTPASEAQWDWARAPFFCWGKVRRPTLAGPERQANAGNARPAGVR